MCLFYKLKTQQTVTNVLISGVIETWMSFKNFFDIEHIHCEKLEDLDKQK